MSASRNIQVLLTGNATQLKSTLVAAGNDVERFNKKVDKSTANGSRNMKMWGAAAMAGGLLVAAGFAYAVTSAVGFEKRMRNVNSISNLSEQNLAHLGDSVRKMSERLPQSANELAEGLYDIASSGFQGAAGMEVLERSAEAASAGMTTTAVSAKGITAVLNAYGLGASEAAHVSNVLFQGVNVGVMTFEELAGAVGDFTGMAAAAGIPIEDTTAAMAAMTLAGISAAESGTSLNRLMQGLIQPSKSLSAVFASWGYESGEAAVKTLGLRGVMEKLRTSTGGNVTQLLQLFPEIRAARGALALMANEGENYAKTSKAMADADKGQGATKKALAEQLKSLSAQWQLFINWLNSAAIGIGMKVLPALNGLVGGAKAVLGAIGDWVNSGVEQLSGFFEDLASSFDNAKETGAALIEALAPLGKLLAGLFLGAVIVALKVLAQGLDVVTGAAYRFRHVLAALLIVYGTFKSVSLATSALKAFGSMLGSIGGMATGAMSKTMALWQSLGAGAGPAGVVAVALIVLAGALTAMANEQAKAKAAAKEFTKELDIQPGRLADLKDAVKEYGVEVEKYREMSAKKGGAEDIYQLVNPFVDNDITSAYESIGALTDEQDKARTSARNLTNNTKMLARALGITRQQAEDYAVKMGVDLTKGVDKSKDARRGLIDDFRATKKEVHATGQSLEAFSEESMEAMEEAMKREGEFLDGVIQGLGSTQDAVAKFGKDGIDAGGLTDFYQTALDDTNAFTANVTKAIQMGLDPGVIKQILTAGPAEAAGILESIVSDSSGNMVAIVNNAQEALAAANSKLLEMSRIAYKASTADSQQMVKDASNATKISLMTMEEGATTSAQAVADALKIPIEDVKRIATEYGIVVDQVNGNPINPQVDPEGAAKAKVDIDAITESAKEFTYLDPEMDVIANIDDPNQKFAAMSQRIMEWVSMKPEVQAYVNTLQPQERMAWLAQVTGQDYSIDAVAFVETQGAETSLASLEAGFNGYIASDPTAVAYLETHSAEQNANFIKLKLAEWGNSSETAQAALEANQAKLTGAELVAWAERWDATHKWATADVEAVGISEAEAALNNVARTRIAQIKAMISSGTAPGLVNAEKEGRWGAITAFANGGITPAHIARGEMFKYGEPETGGEAYIPKNGNSKRSRSILETAAEWYGLTVTPMAKGGVVSDNWQKWYDKLPQLNKDIYDNELARKNSGVKAKPFHKSAFPWAQRLSASPAAPPKYWTAGKVGGTTVHMGGVTVNTGNVYGVKDLDQAIEKGVSKAVKKNYGSFSDAVRSGEDARR